MTAVLALGCGLALGHTGSYTPPAEPPPIGGSGPPPGSGGGRDSGGQVPPSTADPPAGAGSATRWEAWWAANKEFYLRLGERMRRPPPQATTTGKVQFDEDAWRAQREADDRDTRDLAVPIFIEALNDKHFDVRASAAIALGKSGDARGFEPLRKAALKDKHKDVREAAVLALGLIGDEMSVPFLDELLRDNKANTRTRSFAAFGLGLLGTEDAGTSLLRFVWGRGDPRIVGGANRGPSLFASVFVSLGLSGHPRAPAVLRKELELKRHDDSVRSFILLSLGRLKDRESLDRITQILSRGPNAQMRRSSAIALGKMALATDTKAVDALFGALSDADMVTRNFAAVSLGQLADDDIRARLRKGFGRADDVNRPFFALALGLAKDMAAASMLRDAAAGEKNPSDCSAYCMALALMGDKTASPILAAQVDQKGVPWLRSYGALGLGLLGDRSAIPLLRESLASTNESRIKMNFGISLGLLQDPEAKRYFTATMRGDGTLYERSSAAMSLGVLRINSSLPDLVSLYRNPKEQDIVRSVALVAMGVLTDPAPYARLSQYSVDNNYAVTVDPLSAVLSIL